MCCLLRTEFSLACASELLWTSLTTSLVDPARAMIRDVLNVDNPRYQREDERRGNIDDKKKVRVTCKATVAYRHGDRAVQRHIHAMQHRVSYCSSFSLQYLSSF